MRTLISTIAAIAISAVVLISCSDDDGDEPNTGTDLSSSSSKDDGDSSSSSGNSSSSLENSSGLTACADEDVIIGNQVWKKCNSNVVPTGTNVATNSWCNGEEPFLGTSTFIGDDNCETYGRLYDWATAMALPDECNEEECESLIDEPHQGICPEGFHIPTNADWNELYHFVDGTLTVSTNLNTNYTSQAAGRKLKSAEGWSNCGSVGSGNAYVCEDAYGFSALPGGYYRSYDGFFRATGIDGYWWSSSEYNSNYAFFRVMDDDDENAYWDYDYKDDGIPVRCVKNDQSLMLSVHSCFRRRNYNS